MGLFTCRVNLFSSLPSKMHTVSSHWHKPRSRSRKGKDNSLKRIAARWPAKSDSCDGEVSRPNHVENNAIAQPNELPGTSMVNSEVNDFISKSEEKIKLFGGTTDSSGCSNASVGCDGEYIFIHTSALSALLHKLNCSDCGEGPLTVQLRERHGLAHKLCVKCTNCGFSPTQTYTSPRVETETKTQRSSFEINRRSVDAFLGLGVGHKGIEKFSASLGMSGMDSRTFSRHMSALAAESKTVKENILSQSVAVVRRAYIEAGSNGDSVLDVSVSYDGTWHKRGHTSAYGIGIVIDLLTGLVIDYEVVSKYCAMCTISATELGDQSPEYHVWYEGHKSSGECDINYEGSSVAMEMFAAHVLWNRSISHGQMRYTTILSDGDSKTFNHLVHENVYGREVTLKKEECINHVAKRMGTGLRQVVQSWKTKGVRLGGHAKGALTNATITKLTSYYRNAIVNHMPNVVEMKRAIYATLSHYMSTDAKPQHGKCPKGSDSWCFYNKSIADGRKPQSHDKMPTRISEQLALKIIPVYQRLASDELLSRCVRGTTQNQNESLHSLIWRKCPKENFISQKRLSIAVCNAVAEFNMGCSATVELKSAIRDIKVPGTTQKIVKRRDSRRKYESIRSGSEKRKASRRKIKAKKLKREAEKSKKEGVTYGAGQF